MTHEAWGFLIIAIGIAFVFWATTESTFFLYRMFVARSKTLWGDKVYRFHQVVGGILIVVGGLMVAGVI